MNLMICAALLPNVFFNDSLIAVLAYRVRIVSAAPELAAPEHLLHFRMNFEDLFCGNALYDLDHRVGREHGNALNKKVYMIFISTDLNKTDLEPVTDFHAHLFQGALHGFGKNLSPVFRRTHDVVEKDRLVVPLEDVFAHSSILLHRSRRLHAFRKGIRAAELRGMF